MRKLIYSCLLLIFFVRLSAQNQPGRMTEKFFPNPDFNIQTPTNQKTYDQGLCSYQEMMDFLKDITKNHSETVRLEILGKTPNSTEIPILYFGTGKASKKIKVWLQGGLHGNEPAGSEGLFMLIEYLLHNEEGIKLLKNMDLAILPVANVDGYSARERVSSGGFDLNRDQTKFADPVSGLIKLAFMEWNPDAAFDFHEYQPIRKEYNSILPGGAAGYYDALFLPSGYLNVPECLRKMTTDLFLPNAEKMLDQVGYSHNFYFSTVNEPGGIKLAKGGKSPQSSSTSYALSNAVSMLIEIRGIGLGKTSFARRTNTCFLVARSFLQTASAHIPEVRKCIKTAINQTIKISNDIIVTSDETEVTYPVKFIDIEKNELVTLNMKVYDALLPIPTLVRKRPLAYILSSSCKAEVERLRNLGVKVQETKRSLSLAVQRYTITSYSKDSRKWEDIYPVTVKAKTDTITKTFPAGSYVIRLAQENANYAVSLLEPESENGFVSFCVTKTAPGNELPVYRIEKGRIPE